MEQFGSVQLPIAAAGQTPIGDPALGYLGAFLQAVINYEVSTAWAALRPRPGAAEATPELPVRNVVFADPQKSPFSDGILPALFLWRAKDTFETTTSDWVEDAGTVNVLWMFPPDTGEKQRPREALPNGLGKVVAARVRVGRDPAWQHASDPDPTARTLAEDLDSILLARATSLTPVTYSGIQLDGVIGGAEMSPRRELVLTTEVVEDPTYNVVSPVVIKYLDWFGVERTRSAMLTEELGGEEISLGDEAKSAVSLALPSMTTVDGTIQLGTRQFDGAGTGLAQIANLLRVPRLKDWVPSDIEIIIHDSEGQASKLPPYRAVLMQVEIVERNQPDVTVNPLAGPTKNAGDVTAEGFPASSYGFPDAGA